jgi:hypothetical protein
MQPEFTLTRLQRPTSIQLKRAYRLNLLPMAGPFLPAENTAKITAGQLACMTETADTETHNDKHNK